MIRSDLRGGLRAALVFVAFAVAGCASGGGNVVLTPQATPVPTPKPSTVAYTAIGASDAVGYGASVPCTKASPADGAADPTCFGITGTGYVPVLARRFRTAGAAVTLDDLGYSGAVIGPDILRTINSYGTPLSATPCTPPQDYPTDFITYEVPKVTAASTLVTVFAGGNDTIGLINALGCGAGGTTLATQVAFLNAQIAAFGADLQTLIARVKTAAPKAKIVVANVPNFALVPVGKAQSAAAQQALSYFSVGIDKQVINPLAATGIPVVDLLCNSQTYVASNFYTDGFHPNDAGYALFAQLFYAQATAATPAAPQAACSYAAQLVPVRAVTSPLRRI